MIGRLKLNQDVAAGLMFLALGALGLYIARDYAAGSTLRMGPGYMPRLLCWALVVFGAAITVRGVVAGGEALTRWTLRPLVFVLAALIVFGLLIEEAGLLVTAMVSALVGALGARDFRARDTLIVIGCLGFAVVALFIYALRLPMHAWPDF
jgi:putative tricarboxylic transport membrane protein